MMISEKLYKCVEKLVIYLAAAVSDFYLEDLPEHKIQSRENDGLCLELSRVPKLMQFLRQEYGNAFLVGFKLETDDGILESKAKTSLETNKLDLVVGNILTTRREKVTLFYGEDKNVLTLTENLSLEEQIANFISTNL